MSSAEHYSNERQDNPAYIIHPIELNMFKSTSANFP